MLVAGAKYATRLLPWAGVRPPALSVDRPPGTVRARSTRASARAPLNCRSFGLPSGYWVDRARYLLGPRPRPRRPRPQGVGVSQENVEIVKRAADAFNERDVAYLSPHHSTPSAMSATGRSGDC